MASCKRTSQQGYTYFGVLFAIALVGLALAGAALVWQVQQQREKERELLFVGQQYIDAIASYYHASPGGAKKYPHSLEELLRDPRYPNIKRHLRKPWRDPLTGSKEWGLILTKQGNIAGIHSLANGIPIKQAGFGALESSLTGKTSYRDWKFIHADSATSQPAEQGDHQNFEENDATTEDAVEPTDALTVDKDSDEAPTE